MACTDAIIEQLTALVGADAAGTICADDASPCTDATACAIAYLNTQVSANSGAASDATLGLNVSFLLFSGYLVFIMQLGFAMLCAGLIRSTAQHNILLKNMIDACVGGIVWYCVGYGFAFGKSGDGTPFIGNSNFALDETIDSSFDDPTAFATIGYHQFYFQWAFAAATATIVSGAVAERCTFGAYLAYTSLMTGFVYPCVVHSLWSTEGWLSPWSTNWNNYALILGTGAIDFAGSGVVHMTGGVAAGVGAWLIGPRMGRFRNGRIADPMEGHSAHLVVLGTCILWLGWYGFNPGSNLVIAGYASSAIVSRVAVCTTLAACAGGAVMLFWRYYCTKTFDLIYTCNGILGGLVAITAGCSTLEPWAAIICGGFAPLVFCGIEVLMHRLEIDDAVSAFPLHAGCGAYGVLFVGLLAKEAYVDQVYGTAGWEGPPRYGIFYGGHGQLLLCQFIEVLFICAWTGVCMFLLFGAFKFMGRLRVDVEVERVGLDVSVKFFTSDGGLGKVDIKNILERAADIYKKLSDENLRKSQRESSSITKVDYMSVYTSGLVKAVRKAAGDLEKPLEGFHIVVDAGNGAGGFFAAKVLEPLGAITSGSQFLEPDGMFPNHIPNPEDKAAMEAITKAVLDNKADLGIIFDTDVDRSAAVDSSGREFNRNRLIALLSAIVLEEHPGTTIVTDSVTSDGLTSFIEKKLGGKHHRFKRGYKNVIDEAIRLNSVGEESHLAIETSGHGALKENHWLDDGAYLMVKILNKLAAARAAGQGSGSKVLTDLVEGLEEPKVALELRLKIDKNHPDLEGSDFREYGEKVLQHVSNSIETNPNLIIAPVNYEGIRVSGFGGWFLLRLSLHDPVLPLNIEAQSEDDAVKLGLVVATTVKEFNALDTCALSNLTHSS